MYVWCEVDGMVDVALLLVQALVQPFDKLQPSTYCFILLLMYICFLLHTNMLFNFWIILIKDWLAGLPFESKLLTVEISPGEKLNLVAMHVPRMSGRQWIMLPCSSCLILAYVSNRNQTWLDVFQTRSKFLVPRLTPRTPPSPPILAHLFFVQPPLATTLTYPTPTPTSLLVNDCGRQCFRVSEIKIPAGKPTHTFKTFAARTPFDF